MRYVLVYSGSWLPTLLLRLALLRLGHPLDERKYPVLVVLTMLISVKDLTYRSFLEIIKHRDIFTDH